MSIKINPSYITDLSIKSILNSHKHTYSDTIDLASILDPLFSTWENNNTANNIIKLDSAGIIPVSLLPDSIDEVLQYANVVSFPGTGTIGKIYIAVDTGISYRWSSGGSVYVPVGNVSNNVDLITSGVLPVTRGGTGKSSFSLNTLLIGNDTSAINEISNGTVAGQILYTNIGSAPSFKKPDNAVFRVNDYGGVGNDSTDNATAISNCYTAIVSNGGGIMQFDSGIYRFSSFPSITQNNVTIQGIGNSTVLAHTTSSTITVSAHYVNFRDFLIHPAITMTSGTYIFTFNDSNVSCYKCSMSNVHLQYVESGIIINSGSNCYFDNVSIKYMYGAVGFRYKGTATNPSHDCKINNMYMLNNPLNNDPNNNASVSWTSSTSYSVGDLVSNNDIYFICSTAGTSASSGIGPADYPLHPNGPEEIFTNTITDGTVQWSYYCANNQVGLIHDEYAYDLKTFNVKIYNSFNGMYIGAVSSTGSNHPYNSNHYNMYIKFSINNCIIMTYCRKTNIIDSNLSSSLHGSGILIALHEGETTIDNCYVGTNYYNGIEVINYLVNPQDITITNNIIVNNSVQSSGSWDGVYIDNGINRFTIKNNNVGTDVSGTNNQNWGIRINGGTHDNYIVADNIIYGNVSGGLSDSGTGINKIVTGNLA